MKLNLKGVEVGANCPECCHEQAARLLDLQRDPKVTCAACGLTYDTKPDQLVKDLTVATEALERQLGKALKLRR